MKGLILKDLLLIKSNVRGLTICLFMLVLSIFNGGDTYFFFLPMISIIMCLTTFSYDEYNKWDGYSITLIHDRKVLVKSKYIFTIIAIIFTSLLSFLINVILSNINGSVNLEETFETILGMLFGITLFISIMYPIIYKFGIQKSRLFILIISFGLSIIAGLLFKNININLDTAFNFIEKYSLIIIPIISIILIYISYILSYKFYLKRDF